MWCSAAQLPGGSPTSSQTAVGQTPRAHLHSSVFHSFFYLSIRSLRTSDIQLKHFLEEAKDFSLPVFYPGPFFASNETLMRLFFSVSVHRLPRSTRTSPPIRPVWFHRGRSDRMSKAERRGRKRGGSGSPRNQEELG